MSTISVPISGQQEEFIDLYIKKGHASNKAEVMRKALDRLAEEEAIQAILRAQQEPTLRGDLKDLLKKIK